MKALQLEQPKSWKRIDIAEPAQPAAGQALLRVHRIGICGTDIGGYLGKMPFFSYPRIPGHELGVEVVAVGDGVTNIKPGDRCSVEPYINCGHCHSCRRGFTNCCATNKTLGVMCDGGMTERLLLPANKLHPSAKLGFEQLALVETLAIGCHAINRGNPTNEEAVLVIGAGPIGLSAIEFAKLQAKKTIVMDMNEQRLAFVREKMGVPDTILTKGDGAEIQQLEALTDGQLADVVVDATGSNKSMAQALNYCAFKGRLVYVGITQAEISIPHAPALHRRELDILASRNGLPHEFQRIIQLIEDGSINTDPWITHHAPFDGMIDVFESWTKPETGVIKAIVKVA
jgi:2-desacetyl-2-hydroxyethyl bacteriochlorophyllide A dehydrogenase